jgi:hypothetical protein
MGLDGDALEPVEPSRRHVPVPDIELYIAEAVEVENLTFDPSLFDGWVRDVKLDERLGSIVSPSSWRGSPIARCAAAGASTPRA